MNDIFNKIMLFLILICLLITITKKDTQISLPNPKIEINNNIEVISLASDRFAIINTNSNSSLKGTVLVFEFNRETKNIEFLNSINYEDYFLNPQEYGIKIE